MPIVTINTNVAKADIKPAFISQVSALIAKLLEKPEGYVQVVLTSDELISFGGSNELSALVTLNNIGGFDGKTKPIAEELTDLVVQGLGIAKERFYIVFKELQPTEVGFNGAPVA